MRGIDTPTSSFGIISTSALWREFQSGTNCATAMVEGTEGRWTVARAGWFVVYTQDAWLTSSAQGVNLRGCARGTIVLLHYIVIFA